MQTILAPRASSILYDVLVSRAERRPFLLPTNICPIVPITFLKAETAFEFVDIGLPRLDIDLERVEQRLRATGGKYGGLLYAHPYGDEYTPSEALHELKREYPQLIVIDDRCLCVPELMPQPTPSADVTLYSTGYAKIVDIGYGGFAFIDGMQSVEHRRLPFSPEALTEQEANYKKSVQDHSAFSYADNDWLQTDSESPPWDEYKERIGPALAESLLHRKSVNAVYNAMVPAELQLPENYQMWRFNLRVKNKQPVLEAIFQAGLFASSHYASLVGIMGEGDDKNARELADHVINLFNDHHYTIDMAERTAQIVRRSI